MPRRTPRVVQTPVGNSLLSDTTIEVPAGVRASGWLTFESSGAAPARLPVVVVRGRASGVTLWVQAGLHGDEGDGVVALLRWLERLSPVSLKGTIIAVPVVNVPAFLAGAAADPADGLNLNRAFRGGGASWTERFARWLLSLVLRHAGVFVDLHGGGRALEVTHFAFCGNDLPAAGPEKENAGWQLARAAGVRYICAAPPAHAGALYRVLGARGIPAVLLEAGGGSIWREEAVRQYTRALDNILSALEMTTDTNRDAPEAPGATVIAHTVELYAPDDGVLTAHVPTGAAVRAGERVIELRGLTGDHKADITSPLPAAVVLSVAACALLRSGSYACLLGALPA